MLKLVPWHTIKRATSVLRDVCYKRPWPDKDGIIVDADPRDLDRWLKREMGFEGVLLSYKYEGEVMNVRRPWGLDAQGRQLELHARARETEDGLEILAHVELSRYEHPEGHYEEDGTDWQKGNDEMRDILQCGPWSVV